MDVLQRVMVNLYYIESEEYSTLNSIRLVQS